MDDLISGRSTTSASTLSPADGFARGKAFADVNRFTDALPFFNASCNDHFGAACSYLGYMYSNGAGVTKDAAHATILFRSACDAGNASGCYNLGVSYEASHTADDDKLAALYYDKSCNASYAPACTSLGLLYFDGREGQIDNTKAYAHFRSGCPADARACFYLGEMYEWGRAVKKDNTQAIPLYRKACEGSIQQACDHLKRLQP